MPEIRRSTLRKPWTKCVTLALFVCGVVCCTTSFPPDPTDENSQVSSEELNVTFQEYHGIADRNISNRPAPVRAMARRAFHALGQIESIWRQKPRPIPARYRNSLNGDVSSLDQVLQHPNNTAFSANLFSVTVRSLEIKADRAAAFPRIWPDLIDVTVNTVHRGRGVNGVEIQYCPAGWKDVVSHWLSFKQVTPATERIAPSVYYFQARSVQKGPIDIGGDGKPTAEVTIEIP
jgi:hypothetical protein